MSRATGIRVADVLPKGWQHHLSAHPRLGLGFDVATTLKAGGGKGKRSTVSNPSAICLTQQVGNDYIARLMLRFRTNDPAVAIALLEAVLAGVRARDLRIRRLCIDATNERFFAMNVKSHFAGRMVVDPVVASEGTEYLGLKMKFKQYLGSLLVDHIDDGYWQCPEDEWLRNDLRSVKKIGDTFDAEVDENGNHGDCFDAAKLALHALVRGGGPATASAAGTGSMGAAAKPERKVLNPFARKFASGGGTRRAI